MILTKEPKSFNSKRWRQGCNPDLAFVADSIGHQAEKCMVEVIAKTQQRPIGIKIHSVVRLWNVPFQRRYNLKKADWPNYAPDIDKSNAIITPTPENLDKFLNNVRIALHKNIPGGCRTIYVCCLNDQTKEMYGDYQRRFIEDPFSKDTVKYGDALLDKIADIFCYFSIIISSSLFLCHFLFIFLSLSFSLHLSFSIIFSSLFLFLSFIL